MYVCMYVCAHVYVACLGVELNGICVHTLSLSLSLSIYIYIYIYIYMYIYIITIFTNPYARAGYDTRPMILSGV